MFNSRTIIHDYELYTPKSLKEALEKLGAEGAKPLSGGTDLVNRLKDGREKPAAVVYLGKIAELKNISDTKDFLEIGAACTMAEIERILEPYSEFRCLAEAIHTVGGTQIRNTATLAGNLGNASPGADTPPALIVLGAQIECSRLDQSGKIVTRLMPVEEFFTGPGKTVLARGEIISCIRLPRQKAGSGAAFGKLARVTLDIAKVNAAVGVSLEGDRITGARVAFGSVAPTPVRGKKVENLITGKTVKEISKESLATAVSQDISPINDIRSSREYRLSVVPVLVQDLISAACKRSKGE